MRKIVFLFPVAIVMSCFSNGKQVTSTNKIPDGYYHGSDKLFKSVFIKIENDTAITDFIYFQKYPRDLITDTLVYNNSNKMWVGRLSTLYQKNDKYYVSFNEFFLYGKTDLRIKINATYYEEKINEYKNMAVFHKFKREYLIKKSQNESAEKRFVEMEAKYNMNKMLKTPKHAEFLKDLEKFKLEL